MSNQDAVPKVVDWCLFNIDWQPICMPRSEWAAWAQAAGSLLALLIAIAIPYIQNYELKRNARRAAKLFVYSSYSAIKRLSPNTNAPISSLLTTVEITLRDDIARAERIDFHLLHPTASDGIKQLLGLTRMIHDSLVQVIAAKGEHPDLQHLMDQAERNVAMAFSFGLMVLEPKRTEAERRSKARVDLPMGNKTTD